MTGINKTSIHKKKLAEPISVAAHQLKNPISIIKFYIEALSSEYFGKLNNKQKEYLADSLSNVHRMTKIVDYLLDVSKIEANVYAVKPSKFDLTKLIADIVKDFFSWAEASNSEIYFARPNKLPLAYADDHKIRQVIENLISNAIKYKSEERGKIVISLEKHGNFLLFSSRDNGIGIQDKDLKRVFSKFYRSEEAFAIDPSGSGLGLYINKAAVEASGGKIWLKHNESGKGVTFYFTVPIVKNNSKSPY